MAFYVQVKGLKELQQRAKELDKSQVPFATARALTMTAQDAQKAIREGVLPVHFILRRAPFMKAGVRITAAKKQKLEAEVYDLHSFMVLQQEGGTKVPRYGKNLAIPLKRGGARPQPTSLIKKENLPSALMESGRGFIRNGIMYKRWKDYKKARRISIVRGPGAMQSKLVRSKIVAMYALVPRAKMRPRYEFDKTVQFITDAKFSRNFQKAFTEAINSNLGART